MAIYRLQTNPPKGYIQNALIWLISFIAAGIACVYSIDPWQHRFPHTLNLPAWAFFICFLGGFGSLLILLAKRYALKARKSFQIAVAKDGVLRHDDLTKDTFLKWQEIVGIKERQSGVTLLTSEHMRLIHVPSDLEGYNECRAEIIAAGIQQIAPEQERRLWMQAALPLVILFAAMWMRRLGTNPLELTAGAIITLAVLLWFDYRLRRNVNGSGSWRWLILMNAVFLAEELIRIWHHQLPSYYQRAINDLYILILAGAALQWIFRRRERKNRPN